MSNRTEQSLTELADRIEPAFPVGSDNVANLDTTSGRVLTVMTAEAYEKLLADALAWRAIARGQAETMSPEDALAFFNKPNG